MPNPIVDEVVMHRAAMREAEDMAASERAMMLSAMRSARARGVSYQSIADAIGLSRQRVFDMLKDDARRAGDRVLRDELF